MSDPSDPPLPAADLAETPETVSFLLATFADLYRQEVAAEEDVHRTLPFFATALGIVIGALAYAAGQLPPWSFLRAAGHGRLAFLTAAGMLGLAIVEAGCVLLYLSFAIARRNHQRVGPETALRARLTELEAYYDRQGVTGEARDKELLNDFRRVLLDSYTVVTPANRDVNQRRHRYRSLASSHLVRSLIWALAGTSVVFMADKLGYLLKAIP